MAAGLFASAVGRVDYVRVVITDGRVEPLAVSGASVNLRIFHPP